jgi:Mg/Co/Ni transporter MgtE
MIVYAAQYNECVHEGRFGTISLHFSPEGAQEAIQAHKEKRAVELLDIMPREEIEQHLQNCGEEWRVEPIEVLT